MCANLQADKEIFKLFSTSIVDHIFIHTIVSKDESQTCIALFNVITPLGTSDFFEKYLQKCSHKKLPKLHFIPECSRLTQKNNLCSIIFNHPLYEGISKSNVGNQSIET